MLGATVLAGVVLAALAVSAIGSHQWLWGDTFHVSVGFRQIQGVEAGTPVRVRGRNVGQVERVEPPASANADIMLDLRIDGRERDLIKQDATAQIVSEGMVGGKVVEIDPGSDGAQPAADGAVIASRTTSDLTAVMMKVDRGLEDVRHVVAKIDRVLDGVESGRGTLGKLVKDEQAYREMVESIRGVRRTMASFKQNSDALKGMPVVRNYVHDPYKELVRPDCERNRKWFREADLFAPGHAVLTAQGRERLDDVAPWLDGLKHKGSEVVIASYAYPNLDADFAQALTQKQSDAVRDYLMDHHAVHKMGWFSRRKVEALGLGTESPPAPDRDKLPLPRVEVLVFVPQG